MTTGTSASTGPSLAPSSSTSQPAAITIKNFAFQGPASVSPGAKITVTNKDSTSHTVTSDTNGQFDVNVPGGGTATFTAPTKAGHYPYHCNIHPSMHGTLTVQ